MLKLIYEVIKEKKDIQKVKMIVTKMKKKSCRKSILFSCICNEIVEKHVALEKKSVEKMKLKWKEMKPSLKKCTWKVLGVGWGEWTQSNWSLQYK